MDNKRFLDKMPIKPDQGLRTAFFASDLRAQELARRRLEVQDAMNVRDRIPFRVLPMLATLVAKSFDKPVWTYDEKHDGYRILAYKEGPPVKLLSRNSKDRTQMFSRVADAIADPPTRTLLLDGEVVAFDRHGVSRFQLLQNLKSEPRYAVFDCLYRDGLDLRAEPLTVRRSSLEEVTGKTGRESARVFSSAIRN